MSDSSAARDSATTDGLPSASQGLDPLRRPLLAVRNGIRLLIVIALIGLTVQLVPVLMAAIAARATARKSGLRPTAADASPGGITASKTSGGTNQTALGYGFMVNKESSLSREWTTLHDASLPADIVGDAGVTVIFKRGENEYSRGEYHYVARFKVKVSEPLSAIEVRFVTFDAFGGHQRTLLSRDIIDIAKGDKELSAEWTALSENEVSEYFASLTYVARVRTKAGRVVETDEQAVMEQAKQVSATITSSDLNPQKLTK